MDKILLIDGMNAIYRASVKFPINKYYGPHERCLDDCTHKKRQFIHCLCDQKWDFDENKCFSKTNEKFTIIYNFFRNLRPIIEMFSPDKCFFVLEGHPQFRYDLFADYKANRFIKQASKIEVYESADNIIKLLQYLPITICRAHNYECDDVIYSLCEDMKEESLTILSNDSDFIQLLQMGYKNCRIYNPIKKEFMDAPIYPYVAAKSILGDKADNIPGLLKPKKALEIIVNPEKFKTFLSIEENRANFNVNRQLIEFKIVPPEEIIIKDGNKDFVSLKKEFQLMKFESIINERSWKKYLKTFNCIKY